MRTLGCVSVYTRTLQPMQTIPITSANSPPTLPLVARLTWVQDIRLAQSIQSVLASWGNRPQCQSSDAFCEAYYNWRSVKRGGESFRRAW